VATGRRVASEEALIQGYLAPLAAGFPGAYGLMDDCASLNAPPGEDLVLTTDAVAAGVHFLADDGPGDVAWKALAVNVSDLAAKGARPLAYLMSLAFPEAPETAWLESFAAGLGAAQARFAISLAGGDTDRRPGPLAITITAIGAVPAGRMVRRATAKPGDRLFVSGTLGDGAAGLKLRQDPAVAAAWGLDSASAQALIARYLRPEPRLGLRQALLGFASGAMDISDGLAKDLGRLAKASGLRAVVRGADVPLSAPLSRVLAGAPERFIDAITGGDDYEVLAAVCRAKSEGFKEAALAAGVMVTEIGELQAGEGIRIEDRQGRELRIDSPGWEHF
jgi:thiamine-monophosphate kinase